MASRQQLAINNLRGNANFVSCFPQLIRSTVTIAVFSLLVACASHPLGIGDEEWQQLTPAQRLHARETQFEHDRAAEQRRAAEAVAREAEARQQATELETRRWEARYGERVQCVLQPAEAWLNRKWREIEPMAFDLVSGSEQVLPLREGGGRYVRYNSRAYARFDGQQLTLCQYAAHESNRGRCLRLLGTFADYRHGIHRQVAAEHFLRGRLRCGLVP